MLRVENYGAATAKITGDGLVILTDPWLHGAIYMGAWERETPLTLNIVETIGPVDYLWVSHCHPDHLHPESIRAVTSANPGAQVWIGPHCRHLARMTTEFIPTISSSIAHGACQAWSVENRTAEGQGIDSALVVVDKDSAVVNCNDCQPDPWQIERINALTKGKHVTALLPFTGAGPWPQCFDGLANIERWAEAQKKRYRFLEQFTRWKEALHADIAVPFSAGYVLRGPLVGLNGYRGIPRVEEVPGGTVLPIVGASERPAEPFTGYEWEHDPMPTVADILPLFDQAEQRAPKVAGEPLRICLQTNRDDWYLIDATENTSNIQSHETIHLDARLLLGLLTRKYNWNSCEIASVLRIKRHGTAHDRRVFIFLTRFHI